VQALYGNKTGNYNTASGTDALYSNTTGSTNIAEGYKAGYNLTTGSNNIDIGNLGVAAESGTIRIGTTSTQRHLHCRDLWHVGHGQRGRRLLHWAARRDGLLGAFKTAIAPMGSDTAKLEQLRPVSFQAQERCDRYAPVRTHRRGSGEGVSGARDPDEIGPDRRSAL
jgi:hypothetical protein